MNTYFTEANTQVVVETVRARKKWRCSECNNFIALGMEYSRETTTQSSSSGPYIITKQTCLKCFETIKKEISKKNEHQKMKFII